MRVLALDTTTRAGSIAVVDDDRVLFGGAGDSSRSYAERLPGDVIRAIAAAGLTPGAIDLFAVASGPGSFTALRIGIATIQGLAFVTRRRIVPVAALLALCQGVAEHMTEGDLVGAWLDAHRREVFSAVYRVRNAPAFATDRLSEIEAPSVGSPVATWQRWAGIRDQGSGIRDRGGEGHEGDQRIVVAGDGAVLHADALGRGVRVVEPPLLAPIIGRMAIALARQGGSVDPAAVHPLYIRRPDAEIARDAVLDGRRH